ncbi:adenine phosphoribosyltransferase [Thalassospira sp. GB04J01]|uniref:adenine phosphoribosyltransferase n=1 Tax=Thalassospira sp. GB04J01 TaxID=1485225 RepID=UPI000C9BEEDE|nr:adenine phosphoribosyltransferase [Thalassospira sp. GB04J01]|tara:strand:- start:355573 stop:356100 length:528 start_codon:yes stop_codon:yes gene_type:complete
MSIKSLIRTIPDYPKKGIMFRDITTLFSDADGLRDVIDGFAAEYQDKNIDVIAGIEARGFVIGPAVAVALGIGFVTVRKKGKLPAETISVEYDLEYGSDVIEIHKDSIKPGQRVLIMDDLIATGGTALGAIDLVEKAGGDVAGCAFIIDLPDLGGAQKIRDRGVEEFHLVEFEGD